VGLITWEVLSHIPSLASISNRMVCDILTLMDGDILAHGLIELIEYSYQ
jgi:hypothetical protein